MALKLQIRRDTAANWTSSNPILSQGEPCLETDTGNVKYGDGTTHWTSLPYFTAVDTANQRGVSVRPFGARPANSDNTTQIAAAVTFAHALGANVYFPETGAYITGQQTIYSGMFYIGAGRANTSMKLKAGSNTDLLVTDGFASNTGTTNNGPSGFGVLDMTLDADQANQTGRSLCYKVYGYNHYVNNVWFVNGFGGGVYSEWGGTDNPMESMWSNFKIYNYGGGAGSATGLEWNGPHDSMFQNGVVATEDHLIRPTDTAYGTTPINGSTLVLPNANTSFTFATTAAADPAVHPTGPGSFLAPLTSGLFTYANISYTSSVTVGSVTTFSGCTSPRAGNPTLASGGGIVSPTYGIRVRGTTEGTGHNAAGELFTNVHVWGRNHFAWYNTATISAVNCVAEGSMIAALVLGLGGTTWLGGAIYGTNGQTGQTNEIGVQFGSDENNSSKSVVMCDVYNWGSTAATNGGRGATSPNSAGDNRLIISGNSSANAYVSMQATDIVEAVCHNHSTYSRRDGMQSALNGADFADAGTTRANLHVGLLASCQAVATGNITLTGTQTVDGYAALVGDQILCAGQSTASQNGPWVVASGAWTRPTDYTTGTAVKSRLVQVVNGATANIGLWAMLTSSSVTVDTNSTTWAPANQGRNDARYDAAGAAAAVTATKGQANGIASLDGSSKIPAAQLPAVAINNVYPVISQAAMLALSANVGDVAVRSDTTPTSSFMLSAAPAATLGNWLQISIDASLVTSVAGRTGAVTLGVTDVGNANYAGASITSGALMATNRPALGGGNPGLANDPNMNRIKHHAYWAESGLRAFIAGGNPETDSDALHPTVYKCAVEYPAGTFFPLTFNGRSTGQCDPGSSLLSDPLEIDITAGSDYYVRTFAIGLYGATGALAAFRVDSSSVSYSNASNVIIDPGVVSGDFGRPCTGVNIPANSYVGTVTGGTSFLLSSTSGSQTNVSPTGSGSAVNLGYLVGATSLNVAAAPSAAFQAQLPQTVTCDLSTFAEQLTVTAVSGTVLTVAATTKLHATAASIGQQIQNTGFAFQDLGDLAAAPGTDQTASGTVPTPSSAGSTTVGAITAGDTKFQVLSGQLTAAVTGGTYLLDTVGSGVQETVQIKTIGGTANPYTIYLSAPVVNSHSASVAVTTSAGFGAASAVAPILMVADRVNAPKTVVLVGDSIIDGVGMAQRLNLASFATLAFEGHNPWIQTGKAGETIATFLTSGWRRKKLWNVAGPGGWLLNEYGVNDIYGGALLAAIQASTTTLITQAHQRGLKIACTTLTPRTTSSDSTWLTGTQTVTNSGTFNVVKTNYNNWLRGGTSGADLVVETADTVEANSSGVLTRDGGYWKQDASGPYTADGIHPTSLGHALMAAAINTALFV